MYPDRYRGLAQQGPEKDPNPGPRDRAALKPYCEMPDGRPIHNVTQNRAEDIASFEHLLRSIGEQFHRNNVTDAAPKLLDRCYAIVEENKADLIEMIRATYANDIPVMERIRSRAARKAAELLADAYFTALTLAPGGR